MYNDSDMELPLKYENEMRELLKEEYPAYIAAMAEKSVQSLRINTLKTLPEAFSRNVSFCQSPVPWCQSGYYYPEDLRPGTDPYYSAGVYYLQEASAMAPAEILPVEPGNLVLDACCAPGGKSTRLAEKLQGTGVLVSNDISFSRQNATLKNIERFGIANAYVISEDLNRLKERFPETFDRILVDAPCSGEGMFRKEPSLIRSWLEHDSEWYAPLQKEILISAWQMLKKGGKLVYSTCTFSPKENEEVLQALKEYDPEMKVLPVENRAAGFMPGVIEGYENCVRLYPHHVKGEGHFCALLEKGGTAEKTENHAYRGDSVPACVTEFLRQTELVFEKHRFMVQKDKVYYLPPVQIDTAGIRTLRSGLLLGTVKNSRFEPSQALAYALKPEQFAKCISLGHDDIRTEKYLRGETIEADMAYDGWVLVCLEDWPLGFGKMQGKTIKNKLGKGYRKL